MTPEEIAKKVTTEWFGYQNELEMTMALKIVEKLQPKIILEIGVAHGASLAAWCEVAKPKLAISLDPEDIPRTPEQQASYDKLAAQYKWKHISLYTRNPEAHVALEEILDGQKLDFMFIDGAHGFDDVKHDFYEYKKYMKPDGVIGFHDVYYSEGLADGGSQVSWLWDRLKLRYAYDEIHSHSSMGIGFIYLGVPAAKSSHKD